MSNEQSCGTLCSDSVIIHISTEQKQGLRINDSINLSENFTRFSGRFKLNFHIGIDYLPDNILLMMRY